MTRTWLYSSRLTIVTALVGLAIGTAGCGDSDDSTSDRGASVGVTDRAATGASGGQDSGGSKQRVDRAPSSGPMLLGDRAQAKAGAMAVAEVYRDLGDVIDTGVAGGDKGVPDTLRAADGNDGLKRICGAMTAQAERQTIVYVSRGAGLADVAWTCEKAMGVLMRRANRNGDLRRVTRVTVVGVNAEGKRATATVRFGGRSARLSTIPLTKEDGKWKLGSTPTGGGGQ